MFAKGDGAGFNKEIVAKWDTNFLILIYILNLKVMDLQAASRLNTIFKI